MATKIHVDLWEFPTGSGYFALALSRNGDRRGWDMEYGLVPYFGSRADAKEYASRIIREIREGEIVWDEDGDR